MTQFRGLSLSPEMWALLNLVRRFVSSHGGSSPTPLLAGVSPEPLARLAARHALQGFLLRALEGMADPDRDFLRAARAVALTAVAGNLRRIAELHRVLEVLGSAQVPALALKGPALAVQAYGDVSLRSYDDVDVLVPPSHAERSVQALVEAGYADRWARFGRAPSPEHWHDWGFTAPDGKTLVELHWSLTSPKRYPGVNSEEAWESGGHMTVDIGSGRVPALRPELLLPLLAIHAASHSWGWLEFPASVAGLMSRSREEMDWDAVLERAERWHVRRVTHLALLMADELFGEEPNALPESVRRAARKDRTALGLARWFQSRLLLDPGTGWYKGSPALWWWKVRMADTPVASLRAGWQILLSPTPAEWEPGEGPGGREGGPGAATLGLRRMRRLLRRYRGKD